jgi:hypothetical protein
MIPLKPAKVNLTKNIIHEIVIDFAIESHIGTYEKFYILQSELKSYNKLRLFINCPEDFTEIYYFDDADSYYIRFLYKDSNLKSDIEIPWDVISKYLLVRVIPPDGVYGIDSYFRVILKPNFNSAKPITIGEQYSNQKKYNNEQ